MLEIAVPGRRKRGMPKRCLNMAKEDIEIKKEELYWFILKESTT